MAKREYEAPDVGAMVSRMFRALVKRAAEGDLEAVQVLAALSGDLQAATNNAAAAAHDFGYSYTELGNALGISRQAARQRFGAAS